MNNIRPRKRFGQHFLHDRNILDKIITAIDPQAGQHFIEIGPGRGRIDTPADRFRRYAGCHRNRSRPGGRTPGVIASPKLTIHEADALNFDFGKLRPNDAPLRLVGNLPYNISTPLLFHILGYDNLLTDIHVMLQKEVAQRIAAEPGNRTYGRLSVAIAARCEIETLFHIKPGSFTPAPRVDSSLIRLRPDASRRTRILQQDAFDLVVKKAFGQRRKRLSNALDGVLTAARIESAGIDPGKRAEQLSVEEFISLGNRYATAQ